MTHPDGRAYTLQELEEKRNEMSEPAMSRAEKMGAFARGEDPWATQHQPSDGRRGRIPEALEELHQQHGKLRALQHELLQRIEPVLSEYRGPEPSTTEAAQEAVCSGVLEDLLRKIVAVKDMQSDLAYVMDRIEL